MTPIRDVFGGERRGSHRLCSQPIFACQAGDISTTCWERTMPVANILGVMVDLISFNSYPLVYIPLWDQVRRYQLLVHDHT